MVWIEMMSQQGKGVPLDLMAKLDYSWRPSNDSSKVKPISGIKHNKGSEFKGNKPTSDYLGSNHRDRRDNKV